MIDGGYLENMDKKSDWEYEEKWEGGGSMVWEEEKKMHGEWRGLRFNFFLMYKFFLI